MSGWRFLLDENTDPKTATYLEKEGIYAEHVRDALWQGLTMKPMSFRTPETNPVRWNWTAKQSKPSGNWNRGSTRTPMSS